MKEICSPYQNSLQTGRSVWWWCNESAKCQVVLQRVLRWSDVCDDNLPGWPSTSRI